MMDTLVSGMNIFTMRDNVLSGLSQFDELEPEWCLPPNFWERAALFSDHKPVPLGAWKDLPHRKCHSSAIIVYNQSQAIQECQLVIATGYAKVLEKWFRHTWVVNPPDKTLLECTPTKFDLYYGVGLTPVEAKQFQEILGLS